MKVCIYGSRTIASYNDILAALRSHPELPAISEIVSGGHRRFNPETEMWEGADYFGEVYGVANGHVVTVFPAAWSEKGRAAGMIRNAEMAIYADAGIGVWDGASSGTRNMTNQLKGRGKPAFVWLPGENRGGFYLGAT